MALSSCSGVLTTKTSDNLPLSVFISHVFSGTGIGWSGIVLALLHEELLQGFGGDFVNDGNSSWPLTWISLTLKLAFEV
jgi:hypothetical protein